MTIESPTILPAGTKKRIHVDQHRIRLNTKNGTNIPPVTVQAAGGPYKAHEVAIDGPTRVVYQPENPLSCGARLWIETEAQVSTIYSE